MSFREKMNQTFNEAREIARDLGAEVKHTVTHPGETAGYCAYGAASSLLEFIRHQALLVNDMRTADAAARADYWLACKMLPSSMTTELHADRSSGPI